MNRSWRGLWREARTHRRIRQLIYVPILAVALTLMFARTLVMARVLAVEDFGEFSQALLISSTFCMLACMGLQPMLQRDMPIMLIKGRELASFVALVQCVLVAVVCFAVAMVVCLLVFRVPGIDRTTVFAGLLHGLAQQAFLVATVESRSRGQPIRYAVQNCFRGALVLIAGLSIAALGGRALSVIFAESAVSIALTVFIFRHGLHLVGLSVGASIRLSVRRLSRIRWDSAMALLLVTSIGFFAINLDRWIAAQSLEKLRFSSYAFAWTLLMVGQALQVVVNASVFPFLARTFAASGLRASYSVALRLSCGLLLLGAIMFGPAVLIGKFAITKWFPTYQDSAPLVSLFVFVAAIRLADFWSSFLVIAGRERVLVGLNLLAVVVSVLVWSSYAKPWAANRMDLWDIGVLAALLSTFNYVLTAAASWRVHSLRS